MKLTTRLALIGALSLSLSACSGGAGKFFNNLDLRVTERDSKSYIQMTTNFQLGNVSLAEATLTVKDPKTDQDVGTISFSQLADGSGYLSLDVNASLLANADAELGLTMPNGRALPLALNIARGDSMAVKVMENSRVYLGGSLNTTIFAGVAFGIKGLDQVMESLNTAANVFFLYRPSDRLMGVGGIYGSPLPTQNGVAVFAKYTRSGGLLDEEIDENIDNEYYQLDRKTQKGIMNFFYGAPRTIEVY